MYTFLFFLLIFLFFGCTIIPNRRYLIQRMIEKYNMFIHICFWVKYKQNEELSKLLYIMHPQNKTENPHCFRICLY